MIMVAYPVACAFLALLYYKFIYVPKIQQIDRYKQELAGIQRSADRMTDESLKAALAAKRYADISKRFRATTEAIPKLVNIPSTIRQIARVGSAKQVRVVSVRPDISTLLEQYKSVGASEHEITDVEVVITAEGRFADLGRYLFDLSDLPFFKEYRSIKVESSEEIYPRIRAKVRCALCFM